MLGDLLAVGGELDPARFAATPDLDLGLDHAGVADLVGGVLRLLDRGRMAALGTGTPWRANSCLPWYSSRSIGGGL